MAFTGDMWMGLLLGGRRGAYQEWMNQRATQEQAAQASQIQGLLGAPGVSDPRLEAGPPDPSQQGIMQYARGSGFLGNPSDPMERLKLAAGIMSMPNLAPLGNQMLQAELQRQQGGEQFQQEQGRIREQFGVSSADQSSARTQAQANWMAEQARMAESQAWQQRQGEARLGLERARFGMAQQEQQQQAAERAAAAGAPPKPPAGYMWAQSAAGNVLAPMPGTPDYVKAVEGLQPISEGVKAVDTLLTTAYGPVQTEGPLKGQRYGGGGYTSFGARAGQQAAAYQALRGAVLRASGEGKNLSDAEQQAFETSLANPSKFTSLETKRQRAALEYWDGFLRRKQQNYYEANPWMIPPVPGGQGGGLGSGLLQ